MVHVHEECIVIKNTDITTDLNNTSVTVIPWDTGSPELDMGNWTAGSNRIQTDFAGIIRMSCNIHIKSAGSRNSIGIRFRKNTVEVGPRCEGSYTRNSGSHTEDTLQLYYVASCADGDDWDIVTIRHGSDSTDTFMDTAGTSFFSIERTT